MDLLQKLEEFINFQELSNLLLSLLLHKMLDQAAILKDISENYTLL